MLLETLANFDSMAVKTVHAPAIPAAILAFRVPVGDHLVLSAGAHPKSRFFSISRPFHVDASDLSAKFFNEMAYLP